MSSNLTTKYQPNLVKSVRGNKPWVRALIAFMSSNLLSDPKGFGAFANKSLLLSTNEAKKNVASCKNENKTCKITNEIVRCKYYYDSADDENYHIPRRG